MSIRKENLNRELYGFLKSHGYKPHGFLSSGESSGVPEKADFFQFDFVYDGKTYGKISVSIDGSGNMVVYIGNDVEDAPKADSHDSIGLDSLRRYLSKFRYSKALKSFTYADNDDLEPDMKKREHDKQESLVEGYYPVNKKTSYSDNVPATKIIIQHSRVMEEGDQRYRAVEKIFVENMQGERFLLPTTKPGIARVYARHISEGGTPYDERGLHITSLCEEYSKMAGFVRATKNKQFNESVQPLVLEGINHYNHLRETLHKMSGKRGYTEYFNNYKPALLEDENTEDLTEMFKESTLDPRIANVIQVLAKLKKNAPMHKPLKQVNELENWADQVIEGEPGDLETELEKQEYEQDRARDEYAEKSMNDKDENVDEAVEKIAGRYDPVEFDEKIKRLKALAKKNPVDTAKLAQLLRQATEKEKNKEVQEAGPAGKPGDYFDDETVSTGPILGHEPQTQHGLRGKLVGESEDLLRIKQLSGLQK
jgi:hypothetical protein